MKRLKGKKGFTLVECVVAMAVLAIMSMMLTMILNVSLRQRNSNMERDSEIDKQIENIVRDAGDKEEQEIDFDIKLYANGIELSDKIPGNDTDGAKADKIEHKGDSMQMDSLDYDFDNYKKFEEIENGKYGDDGADPGDGYEKSKCYGAVDVENGDVTVTEVSRGGKRKDNGAIDNTVIDGVEYEYYIVGWRISFNTKDENPSNSPEKSVKVRIPKSGKLTAWDDTMGGAEVDALSDTAVRIQPTSTGVSQNDIKFIIPAEDMDDYGSVANFFNGVGSGGSTTVKIDY